MEYNLQLIYCTLDINLVIILMHTVGYTKLLCLTNTNMDSEFVIYDELLLW